MARGIVNLSAAWRRYVDIVGPETSQKNTSVTDNPLSYSGYRFLPDVISYAVWLYYRFPLSLRMVEELLAARGIELTYETVRRWAVKFGLGIARRIRSAALARGGPARRGARCAGAKPTRQACGQAAHAQAVKEAWARPTCTDHR